ncbi:SDR family oxidoreductase [Novosphingobium sp. Fuku2-ISO-50]|uniref:SDR family oxidoreductase n=1 Tax=Novosphingobium sp. Fuku2-ISO-50 TaxID=1739114 RepID=UPI00076D6341|nr:SDR family oxidoreductase [Novosphingobium sp. Fuku2-ISO-50]KUR76708.1 oxidoreductase [Novosphingobium sp. Fuku2-ISO-50]
MTLTGKTAVITGASAGIGAATAQRLAQSGAQVLLVARRQDRLDALARDIGAKATTLALDLSAPEAAQAMLDAAVERLGRIDILVNNAGILRTSHVDAFDLAELEPLIAINYTAVVRASMLFARVMKAQGSGQIVNISSIGASLTAAGTGVYGGLKAALERFTDVLRIELAGSGVRVGLVAPGTTTTEIFGDMKAKGQPGWDEFIPPLAPDDIARAVAFMCEQSGNANAARIHIYATAESF